MVIVCLTLSRLFCETKKGMVCEKVGHAKLLWSEHRQIKARWMNRYVAECIAIKQSCSKICIRWTILSIESYWTVEFSSGMLVFTDWSIKKERSCITLNFLVLPLGTRHKGEETQFSKRVYLLAR